MASALEMFFGRESLVGVGVGGEYVPLGGSVMLFALRSEYRDESEVEKAARKALAETVKTEPGEAVVLVIWDVGVAPMVAATATDLRLLIAEVVCRHCAKVVRWSDRISQDNE
jgi:hypothetical protein